MSPAGERPALMDPETWRPVRPLASEGMELTLSEEAPWTAVIALAPGEQAAPGDWVRITSPGGDRGIFRVAAVMVDGRTGRRTAELEHGIAVLGDALLPDGEPAPAGDCAEVIEALLAYQPSAEPRWRLGRCDLHAEAAVEEGCRSALDGLAALLQAWPEYALRLDQEAVPWTLGLVKRPEEPRSEGRLSRNIRSARLRLEGEETSAWLEARMLAGTSGEALDRFRIGEVMRLALPGRGITVTAPITWLYWKDALGAPEDVRLCLGGGPGDMASRLRALERETAFAAMACKRSAAASGKNAAALRAQEERLADAGIEIDRAKAQIALCATQSELGDVKSRLSAAGIRVDGSAAEVQLLAAKTEVDLLSERIESAEASITVQAGEIELKVSQDGIISAINQSAESVTIRADRINLNGYVTADALSAVKAGVDRLTTGQTTADALSAKRLYATQGLTFRGNPVTVKTVIDTDGEEVSVLGF